MVRHDRVAVGRRHDLSEPARGFSVLATDGDQSPPVNFQAGMQQPGILQPAEADSLSIGHRRFTEDDDDRLDRIGPAGKPRLAARLLL
jgi:hypothetical protein